MGDDFGVDDFAVFADVLPGRLGVRSEAGLAQEIEKCDMLGRGSKIQDGHGFKFGGREAEEFHGGVVDLKAEEGFAVENPGWQRVIGEEEAEHGGAIAESVFGAAALDGEGDVAADGVEKFEVALVVDFFVAVVLDGEDADGRGRSLERDAEPGGRWRADEFDFAALGEAVEFVGEECEVEVVGFAIVENDETILGVENLAERLVDAEQELIEIGGFVERVNDVGDDLALFLHAAQIGDVEEADDDGFDAGIAEMVLAGDLEPAPGAVFALDAVVVADPAAGGGDEFVDAILCADALIGVEEIHDGSTDEFAVEIAEDAAEAFAGINHGAVAG